MADARVVQLFEVLSPHANGRARPEPEPPPGHRWRVEFAGTVADLDTGRVEAVRVRDEIDAAGVLCRTVVRENGDSIHLCRHPDEPQGISAEQFRFIFREGV